MSHRYYIYVLLLLFAIIALADRYLPSFEALSMKSKSQTTASDFFLENLDSTVMQANGKPDYTLKAQRLTHYPDSEIVDLAQVEFKLLRKGAGDWRATAEQGQVEKYPQVIHLSGNVLFSRPASAGRQPVTLRTPELHIYTDKDIAETDAAVRITSGNNQISAVGMRLYLEEGRMEFMSSTRVEYHAPAP